MEAGPVSWHEQAACRGHDTNRWFIEEDGRADHDHVPADIAAICGDCPVSADCLDYALRRGLDDGIWGGLSPKDRGRYGTPCPTCETLVASPNGRIRRYCGRDCAAEGARRAKAESRERQRMAS